MNDQSVLLERYLSLLRENPNAEPPPELDASLAAFARQMMQHPPASAALRSRVWQRALESQAHPNGAAPNYDYFDKETHPMQSISIPKRRNAAVSWPLLAVIAAVCVIAVLFFSRPPKSSVLSPSNLQTLQPTETATATITVTVTATATWSASPTETLTITPSFTATSTPVSSSQTIVLETASVPIMEITPAPFGSADGTINGTLSGANTDAVYHFVTTGAGVVAVNLSTHDIALINLESSVTHAGNNGGGGGGGGGGGSSSNPLAMQSIGTHILVLPGDDVSVAVRSNTSYAGYSPAEPIAYGLDVRYMGVIDLGSKAFDGYTDNSLNDYNPLALYKFEVNAGDIVTIRATGVNGFDTTLELYDSMLNPVGDISTAFDYDSGAGYDPELYRHIMPATGTYYVAVIPGSVGFGSYRLQLTRETVPSLDSGTQTANFNSPANPRFTFAGHKGQTVTINVMLPADALDYQVQSVDVTVEQDGKLIDTFNHSSALQLTQAGIVLSAPVTLQSDSPVYVQVNASAKLIRPSQQQFHLEISVAQ